jgi:uncharacterized protein (TIGR02466 family)
MKLQNLFSVPLFVDYLDLDNNKIIDFCYNYKEKNLKNIDSLAYQSDKLDLNEKSLIPIVLEIQSRIKKIKQEYFSFKQPIELEITTSWFNLSRPNGINKGTSIPHLHSFRFLTCVYYPLAEENSGNLILLSPNNTFEYALPFQIKEKINDLNSNIWSISSESSKLLIFPGWIMHYVEPNNSTSDRISIVFNVSLSNIENIVNQIY